ncbi:hypothetical protein K438DRAFT_356696 [Mycena galopus ATCC 62051]|nr:hypothetical protein K438DRAFT_356696 [Mycena galopus ATCC 62051]
MPPMSWLLGQISLQRHELSRLSLPIEISCSGLAGLGVAFITVDISHLRTLLCPEIVSFIAISGLLIRHAVVSCMFSHVAEFFGTVAYLQVCFGTVFLKYRLQGGGKHNLNLTLTSLVGRHPCLLSSYFRPLGLDTALFNLPASWLGPV